MRERIFTHMVINEDGESIKRFQSKREAEWFIENKRCLYIIETGNKAQTVEEMLAEQEECLF